MRLYYSDVPFTDASDRPSIFLAGPTPRDEGTPSWRPEAISLLQALRFDGHVFIPEPLEGKWPSKDEQIDWETIALETASAILFWIPRDMVTMPGLTTNDEWGYWKRKEPKKICLGTPPGAWRVYYQRYWANKLGIPVSDTLVGAVGDAIRIADRKR